MEKPGCAQWLCTAPLSDRVSKILKGWSIKWCCIASARCLSFIPRNSPHLPKSLCTPGFIYKLAVKCCSLFDSLQLIAHNLSRLQDASFINGDIFQKAVQLAALHIAYIFHISRTGHMQNHFTVAQTQERWFGRKARGQRFWFSFFHSPPADRGKSSNISLPFFCICTRLFILLRAGIQRMKL